MDRVRLYLRSSPPSKSLVVRSGLAPSDVEGLVPSEVEGPAARLWVPPPIRNGLTFRLRPGRRFSKPLRVPAISAWFPLNRMGTGAQLLSSLRCRIRRLILTPHSCVAAFEKRSVLNVIMDSMNQAPSPWLTFASHTPSPSWLAPPLIDTCESLRAPAALTTNVKPVRRS